ncbi:hypothetical protein QBC43DRAFT_99695 [Cladorrhinum sp. PSN259]|nr:hypothetical protein QBC43DRAFT_99695 [Cladorrhinum sp. PSN259]
MAWQVCRRRGFLSCCHAISLQLAALSCGGLQNFSFPADRQSARCASTGRSARELSDFLTPRWMAGWVVENALRSPKHPPVLTYSC